MTKPDLIVVAGVDVGKSRLDASAILGYKVPAWFIAS